MNKNIPDKLKTLQGYFNLQSLEVRINYTSELIGFNENNKHFVKSNSDSKDKGIALNQLDESEKHFWVF